MADRRNAARWVGLSDSPHSPINIKIGAAAPRRSENLTVEEAEGLIDGLQAAIDEVKSKNLVSVHVFGQGRYTYRDPSGRLRPGDVVIVPFGTSNSPRAGTVTDKTPVISKVPGSRLKDVVRRVSSEALS